MIKMDSILTSKDRYNLGIEISKEKVFLLIVGFLLARVSVLDKLTPFGFAFLGAYIITKENDIAVFLSVLLGTLSLQGLKGSPYLLGYISLYMFFKFFKEERDFSLIKSSVIITVIFLVVKSSILVFAKPFFLYELFLTIFESILVFTMTYIFCFSIPIEEIKGSILNNEKIICTFITLALVLSGFNDIGILGISFKNAFSIIIILYLSYNQGPFIGGTMGIVMGMVAYIGQPEMPFIIGMFGITGLLSGVFRDLGAIGSLLGFVLGNIIISYYINGLGTSFLGYEEIVIAAIIFLISLKKVNPLITEAFNIELSSNKDHKQQKDDITIKKLNRTADLFNKLSSTFKESAEEKDYNLTTQVYSLVDGVVNKTCMKCENYENCWEENYYSSYNNFFNLVSLMEVRDEDDKSLSIEAKKFCIRDGEVLEKIDRAMENLKLNHDWDLILKDNRILLSEQLEGVGKIIENIASDIYVNPTFNKEIEENLYKNLKNSRMDVKEVSIAQMNEDDFEIYIELNSSFESENKIKKIVSQTLGYPVVADSTLGSMKKDSQSFKLIRSNRFSAMTNMANQSNSENKVSGDSFTFGEIEKTHFTALSDGMGIGRRANEESKVAISLLERLMEANVDKDLTLKTINSVLRVKSNEEIFTTLDFSFIDLYTGKLQMIKTGSPATFIKRKDRIEVINSKSLPVGMLKDVDFNIYEEYVEDGDIIIIMSDGISEASREMDDTEEWMKNIILNIDSINPQTIANTILEKAKEVALDTRDDMTVLVTKVWKNI